NQYRGSSRSILYYTNPLRTFHHLTLGTPLITHHDPRPRPRLHPPRLPLPPPPDPPRSAKVHPGAVRPNHLPPPGVPPAHLPPPPAPGPHRAFRAHVLPAQVALPARVLSQAGRSGKGIGTSHCADGCDAGMVGALY